MAANSVFARLNYSFDDKKFGDSIYLTDQAKKFLELAPPDVTEWQQNDIADDVVSRSRYYVNPTADVCSTLLANANIIFESANSDPANTFTQTGAGNAAMDLANTTALFITEIIAFKSHTDNISGLTIATSNSTTIPQFDSVVSIGQQLLTLTNTTDGISNSTPMLGSLTSLFIGDDLANNNLIIHTDRLAMDAANVGGISSLTANQINLIITHVQTANTLVSTRRYHDWNFYEKSYQILSDYYFVKKFTNMGNTSTYLVNNLIGTDLIKTNIANT
jgi:hypothetical protein